MKIIFAQGNPEPEYTLTRHNVGFSVLNTIADEHETKWDGKTKFNALITEVNTGAEKVLLVKPNSYYNETGTVVRKFVDFYKLDPSQDLLVIHDDLALPFGTVRTRQQGSDAGNNGIKSINSHIEKVYTRIRIGINNEPNEQMDDSDFVLAKFSADEMKQLEKTIIPQVLKLVDQFCNNTLKLTSYKNIE